MAVIDDNTGETLALSLPEKLLEIEASIGAMANVLVAAELTDRKTLKDEHARVKSFLEQAMARARERLCQIDPAYAAAFKAQDEAQLQESVMLGKVIYRNSDREMTADLFAALTCRYPTKGLELTRDRDLHLIKCAGDTTVIEAFVAGMGWEQNRVAMAAIHSDEAMDSNRGA